MGVFSDLFYWVQCDRCDARVPEDEEGVVAWSTATEAEEVALSSDWDYVTTEWLCPDCRIKRSAQIAVSKGLRRE